MLVGLAAATMWAVYIEKANGPAVLGAVLCVACLAGLGSAVLPRPWVGSTPQGPLAAVASAMIGLAAHRGDALLRIAPQTVPKCAFPLALGICQFVGFV